MSAFGGALGVGPIRGYRWWRATRDGWLESRHRAFRWRPGANTAQCHSARRQFLIGAWRRRHPHGIPGHGCDCGFYGLHAVPGPGPRFSEWELDPAGSGWRGHLFGVVAGWGRVIIGTEGWRAQHARPLALFLPGSCRLARKGRHLRIADRYGIPVFPSLDALVSEFGPDPLPAAPGDRPTA